MSKHLHHQVDQQRLVAQYVFRLSNSGMTDHLTPPTVPICLLVDKDMGLQEPVVGTDTTGSCVAYHINPDDVGRESLKHWIVTTYLHV